MVVWAQLDGRGEEAKGFRPCIVIQNNKGNKHSPTTIVAPLIVADKVEELKSGQFIIKGKDLGPRYEDSVVLTDKLKVIDGRRIRRTGNIVPDYIIEELDKRLLVTLGIDLENLYRK